MPNTKTLEQVTLKNDSLSLELARDFGPRVISLKYRGGPNLLAQLPDFETRRPDGKTYRFYGGHRLWIAPEDPILSYALDDLPLEITHLSKGLLVRKPVEPETGLEKSMHIVLADGQAKLTITHQLTNRGTLPIKCAPWTITQLRKGGVGILPQASNQTGLLPNRLLVLWPYTDVSSPNLYLGNRYILVRAVDQPNLKIGFPNPHGWLGYWLDGTLFVKQASYEAQADYVDFGCSSECFCNDRFIELETLGPLSTLAPGDSVMHTEAWSLYGDVAFPEDEDTVQAMIDKIGLE
jgi:hypothetical protein